jgi:hypothetical protein
MWATAAPPRAPSITIALFGAVCELRLVCSPRLDQYLERHHREWYDEYCLTESWDGWGSSPPLGTETESEATQAAWETISDFAPNGGRLRLIEALSPENHREVRELKADPTIKLAAGTIGRYVQELADEHGLVAIDTRPRYNRVRLTERGAAAQTLLGPNHETQHPAQTSLDGEVAGTTHETPSIVWSRDDATRPTVDDHAHVDRNDETATPAASDAMDDRSLTDEPTAEEWLAATGTASEAGYVQWLEGPTSSFDTEAMHERLLAGRRVEGVTCVDEPVEAFEDGRVSYVSCVDEHAQVVAQWGGALPTLVRITSALLSEKMFSSVLTPAAVGDDLKEVYDGAFEGAVGDVLRLGAQMGWLPDERAYDGLRERYSAVRRQLLAKLDGLADRDDPEAWNELCRDAHGLLASATHLYRAAGYDLTIHVRVPDTARLQAGEQRYREFREFFKHTVPKNAAYGIHSVYRMLFEKRADKLQHRMGYAIDEAEPTAELTASWVVSGPTATRFRADIADAIAAEADDVRERIRAGDEQGVALPIPVVESNSYGALRRVLERHSDRRDAGNTGEERALVRACAALVGSEPGRCSPYAFAEILLRSDDRSPLCTIDDLTRGLTELPAKRLAPSLPPTMRKALQTLLVANKPLGRADIVARADIAGSSYDRNIDELAAFDVVEAIGNGGHRKWQARLQPWLASLVDGPTPWTADTGTGGLVRSDQHETTCCGLAPNPALDPAAARIETDPPFEKGPWRTHQHQEIGVHRGRRTNDPEIPRRTNSVVLNGGWPAPRAPPSADGTVQASLPETD